MLLYLCSEARTSAGGATARARRPTRPQRTVHGPYKSAGRIGAALRAAQRYHSATGGEETGRHVAPHLRKPQHWHHYWTGPLSDPGQRQLVLRYLAPISVGSELPVTTVVRPAS